MSGGKEAFRARTSVSRETFERLEVYAGLLGRWSKRINLVSPKTLPELWNRHFLDSAQLMAFAPPAGHWLDIGSGGGFPGAVLAIVSHDSHPGLRFTLVESDQRKAVFLRTVARETGVQFEVLTDRVEAVRPQEADVISARALAPLKDLLDMAVRHLKTGGILVFPKGASADVEIAEALEHWRFDCEKHPSETDPEAVILKIGEIERV